MTPEELDKKIEDIQNQINSLRSSTTIPFDMEQAIRDRLRVPEFAILNGSTKTAASETQSVNEGGVATYSVAKPPDGFREFVVGGTTLYIPYYL